MMKEIRWWLVAFAILISSGCSNRMTVENFNRIKTGMTLDQVKEILGEPVQSYQTLKTWRSGSQYSVTIEFDDRGLVVNKNRSGF